MNNKILAKAKARIDYKRQKNDEIARENLQFALKDLNFNTLYKKQRELEIEIAKKEAYGEKVDYSVLEKLKKEQEKILKKLNMTLLDIAPNYSCKKCNDNGYIKGELCSCLKSEINKELLAYSGFSGKLVTFADNKYSHPAFDLMQKWCEVKSSKINILISGHTGTGKTFLTECIASRLMEKNKTVLFITAFNLNNAMLNYHISFDASRDQIIQPFLTTECLIIDDLGSEPILKNVTKEYLYLILNERMLNNLPTIITTNLDISDILNTYGERVLSRISNKKISIMINLESEDKRLRKNDG